VGSFLAERELNSNESSLLNGSHNLQELWKALKTIAGEVETETGIDPPRKRMSQGLKTTSINFIQLMLGHSLFVIR